MVGNLEVILGPGLFGGRQRPFYIASDYRKLTHYQKRPKTLQPFCSLSDSEDANAGLMLGVLFRSTRAFQLELNAVVAIASLHSIFVIV